MNDKEVKEFKKKGDLGIFPKHPNFPISAYSPKKITFTAEVTTLTDILSDGTYLAYLPLLRIR